MQDRKTYAKGVTNVTADAKARIGMPVVDGEYTVASEATLAYFAGEIPESGSMLVTLEVNGTVIAYRELYTFDSEEEYIHVGDYYIANDSGSVAVETMEGGDVVRLKVEPVEIEINDVFRAAVGKVAPKSEGGGSGGGVLVVTCTGSGGNIVVDKKAGEIYAASKVGIVIWINAVPFLSEGEERADTLLTAEKSNEGYVFTLGNVMFSAASADDYPTFME